MKRVLLTGVGGFIGAHCVEYFLKNTDWFIIGLDSFRHKGTYSRLAEIELPSSNLHPHGHYEFDPERVQLLRHDLSVPIDIQLENRIMDRKINERGQTVEKKLDYIVNMASDSAVERSVSDPGWCWRNNCELIYNMLELARRVKPKIFFQVSTDEVYGDCPEDYAHPEWDVIVPSNPYAASKAAQEALAISYWRTYDVPVVLTNCMNCHHPDAKAFTPQGEKKYHEISVGDEVFVLKNGELVAEKVLEVIEQNYDGPMVRIDHQKTQQYVTANHRVMLQKPTGHPRKWGEVEYVPAADLFDINRFRIPLTGFWKGINKFYTEVEDLTGHVKFHPNTKRLPKVVSTDWLLAICGWFVSEGSIAPGFISFPQEKPEGRKALKDLLGQGGMGYSEDAQGFSLSCGELSVILEEFGRKAENKRIPTWVKSLSAGHLQHLFDAAMMGDGSRIKNRSGTKQAVYYTISRQLAEDMAEIGMKLGHAVRISERWTWNPEKTRKSKSYIVRYRIATSDVEKRNLSFSRYQGKVWCLRVPSGNFAISYNGVISFSGNCIGTWQDKEKFLPKLIWKIATDQPMEIYADFNPNGECLIGSRFYLHCDNHADVFKWLSDKPIAMYNKGALRPDRYNVVGEVELDNLEMAKLVAEIMGKKLNFRLVSSESARRGYDRRYALDGKKLQDLGWKAPVEFRKGMESIVKWTLDHPWWLV